MNDSDSVLRTASRTVRQSFGKLYLAAAWPYLFALGIMMVLRLILLRYADSQQTPDPTELWRSMSLGAKLGVLLAFVAVAWLPAGLAYASVSQSVLQAELSVDEVIRNVLRRIAPSAVLTIILGLAITVGNFVFSSPAY